MFGKYSGLCGVTDSHS